MMEVPPVYVREDVSHPYALHGSAVPVDARSLITCGHVLRPILQVRRALDHDGGAPQESFLLGAEILGLIRVGDRDVVRAYISPSADLAVLQTRQERKVTTLRLARSLAVSSVFAFGYSIRESAVLCQQGPLALGAPLANDNGLVWLSADIGLPNGFSGGPWLSRINGLDHVMGISWLGGDGAATGRAIAAPRCLEFMKEAEPLLGLDSSKWSITDPRQIMACGKLADSILDQARSFTVRRSRDRIKWRIVPSEASNPPDLNWVEQVTARAVSALRSGDMPDRLCFFVDIDLLSRFISKEANVASSPTEIFSSFLSPAQSNEPVSAHRELIGASLSAGVVVLVLYGSSAGDPTLRVDPRVTELLKAAARYQRTAAR